MDHVTFKRIAPGESHIHRDGDHAGDIDRQPDRLDPGGRVPLSRDPKQAGPSLEGERSGSEDDRREAGRRVRTPRRRTGGEAARRPCRWRQHSLPS